MHDLIADGNSIILVDHDTQILSEADWLIEMGPEAGAGGGYVITQGTIPQVIAKKESMIGPFLAQTADMSIRKPIAREEIFALGKLHLSTDAIHTVKPLEIDIPKGRLTVVTGVSGSGKTTLALHILAQAQKLGFAEEDPSLDVNGWDAAHKALILAMLAYGTTISPDKIYVRGIENITSRDFEFAKKLGYTIKLLVVIRYHEGQEDALELRVQPCFVHDWHILASVNGVFNAISVNGDIVGETLFYGRGAGKNPTASAVISDIITAMRESRYPEYHTGFNPYAKACGIMHINDTVTPYYVRFQVADQPGVIAEIARILATFGIGISATSSAPSHIDEGGAPWNDLVFILHSCPWGQLQKALEEITRISCVAAEPRVLRIEHLLPQS